MRNPNPDPNPNPEPKPNHKPSTENTYDRIRGTRCTVYRATRISPSMVAYWPRTILDMWALLTSHLRAIYIRGKKL